MQIFSKSIPNKFFYDLARIRSHAHYKVYDEITDPFPNFNSKAIKVWEWIGNFIQRFTGHVITYPCWDSSKNMLAKKGPWFIEHTILR